ncbi:methylated-DNA--protein-cysteine methyltransferase-like [Saccoglossus kowalevskii]|uniref:Methylated-DNA--protein-cysteine methyltransferase n=1 Tax=Saccoglossus kowalevskii TaxID=10224 RepID=A0ABM0MBW5_SACKO|nr:PREDICTED: methylated-DNA--protein-cysteine methyltransferase-like [Saccoglossus kowalevskii]
MTNCVLSYAWLKSPIGEIIVSACSKGVHQIQLSATSDPSRLERYQNNKVEVLKSEGVMNKPLTECTEWLSIYFSDLTAITEHTLPPMHLTTTKPDSFTASVWKTAIDKVPVGETVSYGELAAMCGNPKACRAVGGAMRSNQIPLLMPCHRVVGSHGNLGNYMSGKGLPIKKWLLKHEGVQGY